MDEELLRIIDLFDNDEVTTADKIDRPQQALEKEMYDDFMKRNKLAGGGMLVQPSVDGSRPEYKGEKYTKDKTVLDAETIKKIKDKITLKPGQKWNFYDPKKNPKGYTYGVPKGDPKYDIARNLKPGRLETKLKKAKETYQKIKADPELLAQKKAYDRERFLRIRDIKNEQANLKYSTDKDFREKKLEWARQDRIKNPEKYKKKLNDYFAKKGRFPPGNNYKENVWRDMFRSSQKSGQKRFLLVDENGSLLTEDKFPKVDGKVRWDVGGAYKKVKFYDTTTKQFVKLDNSIKGKGVTFEKYLDQKSVGGKGAYQNAINGYKNKDDIKNLTFKDSKGKSIRLGTIVQQRLNDGVNFINSGVNVQHPDLNNAFWKNEVTLASANNQLNYLEQTLERQLKNAGNDINARTKAINNFKSEINRQPGGITKIVEGETLGVKPTAKSVVEGVGKEFKLTKFKNFQTLLASLGDGIGKNNLQKLAAIGCPGKMMGGRIGFFEGQNLNACAAKGIQKLQTTDVKKLTPGDKANVRAITKTVQGGRLLKNVLGPGALAFEGLFAAPFAAYDYARGRPGIDVAKSALSLGLLDQKLTDAELKKIYSEYGASEKLKNVGDRLTNLERLQKGTRGQRIRSRGKFNIADDQFKDALEELKKTDAFKQTGSLEKAYLENIKKSEEAEQELQRQYDIRKQDRTTQFDLSDPFMAAGGGIAKMAGVDSGPPPEKGPMSQGLPGLLKRVKKG